MLVFFARGIQTPIKLWCKTCPKIERNLACKDEMQKYIIGGTHFNLQHGLRSNWHAKIGCLPLERSERSHKWIYINWNLSALCLTHLGFRVCIELSENLRRNNPSTHDTTQFWLCSRFEAPRLNLGWARMESEQYKGQKLSRYGQITMNSNTSLCQHFWSKAWPLLWQECN